MRSSCTWGPRLDIETDIARLRAQLAFPIQPDGADDGTAFAARPSTWTCTMTIHPTSRRVLAAVLLATVLAADGYASIRWV
ncbi:MAG: hypothetical protein H0W40_07640 [Methylibium sp.]|uniref:hypothetical protein n=1 Tax=Methylibium sp. TaxID=2067992 RepID=UPI00179F8567|nr:hypothetical protein [Methylibium sp.]MBA2722637.1 hypothetical protein [Methylibium sp.]MBA3588412.1 hypothetical protein [Methylibium sp.]MBA3597235.1 hypothetical protein [Methylibium sp.]